MAAAYTEHPATAVSPGAAVYLPDTWEYGVFTQPVRAGFSADPITGNARLAVTFTNDSSGAVDSLAWDYGDGITGATSALTHTHVYTWPGVYTVTLRVAGLGGSDALTRSHYITVTYPITTRVITYAYDPLYRLTGADYSTGEVFTYEYDAVGNRKLQIRILTSTTVTTYTYDIANRLDVLYTDGVLTDLEWDENPLRCAARTSRQLLLAQGTSVYTWDAANRLTGVDVDGVVSAFEYDGLGNRTAQTVDGLTTEYVLDVAGGLPEVILATTGGSSIATMQIQGQVLAQHEAGAWTYALPDHLGSVRQLADAAGQVALAQSYDPFGNLFESSGSGASDFGYTGEAWDGDAELLFLRARYYDPTIGRFLSKDQFSGFVAQPQSINGYTYVENRSSTWVDPGGYYPLEQEGGNLNPADPITRKIIPVLTSGWDLLSNLHPGGFYGAGTISFGSISLDIWVEPRTFSPQPDCPGFGSYSNSNVDALYETVLWITGMTNLVGFLGNTAARYAGGNNPTLYPNLGRPAKLMQYEGLHIDLNGSSFYSGSAFSQDTALSGSTPPRLFYGELIRDVTPKYPKAPFRNMIHGLDSERYSEGGLLSAMPSSAAHWAPGALNATKLAVDMLEAGDVGLRKYQVLVQKWRPWQCYEGFTGRRAVIRTYQLWQHRDSVQIRPSYLYIRPDAEVWEYMGIELGGALREADIVYPSDNDLVEEPLYRSNLDFLYEHVPWIP